MPVRYSPGRASFGLLPEPEGRLSSFVTSTAINLTLLALFIFIGMTARHAMVEHKYEQTELIVPSKPPQQKVKPPDPPKLPPPPKAPDVTLEAPRIKLPKPEPKPELKPIQMEAKVTVPQVVAPKPQVILAPQPKAAIDRAAMPAQDNHVKPSTAPVHLGQTFGVTPNPNATRPATIAAIGNPYGGMQGPAIAPHGIPGSTGIGNGLKFGSSTGAVGKVASAGIPAASVAAPAANSGKVAAAAVPDVSRYAPAHPMTVAAVSSTDLEVLSKPAPTYPTEARQAKIQGDVILRVRFTATGRVVILDVVQSLGHGLDEEARRVAQQIRFRPATRNGQAVDLTTNITISFQLA